MKNLIYKAIAVLALSATFTACSTNDESISGTGNLAIEFDNSFKGDDLILDTQANTTASNEVLKISSIKYIISNIVLELLSYVAQSEREKIQQRQEYL